MLVKLRSAALIGIESYLIEMEIEHKNGFPGFDIVGLPDVAIKEAKERVIQSIRHSGFDLQFRRVLCNLAPASIRKAGTYLDLPLALGILSSSGCLDSHLFHKTIIVGELGFEGQLRPIQGALSIALLAQKKGFKKIIFPQDNYDELKILHQIELFPVKTLNEAIDSLQNKKIPAPFEHFEALSLASSLDFSDVKGQHFAKRALEIAATGFHNILLVGSPGIGKSMLAKRLPGIMPLLSIDEAIEVTQIYSASHKKGNYEGGLMATRPFRSPHHSSSEVSIAGGGSIPKPGEISLAHNGILFLDEFPEFKRSVFEVLREPLEDFVITIARTEKVQQFPARFLLVAAMNPCPCGYAFHPSIPCHCSSHKIQQYYHKVSGPILDRIDIQVQMKESQFKDTHAQEENSESVRERVLKAVDQQAKRFRKNQFNSQMTQQEIQEFCQLDNETENILKLSMEKFSFSLRGYYKILKIARTIADLEEAKNIQKEHVLEAIQYRNIEKRFI